MLGNTSHKKNRFLSGIARKGRGGGPCRIFWPFCKLKPMWGWTLLALHWSATIFTGEVWKTSKNDFSNRECPYISGGNTIRVSLQGCKDVCMEKQGCTGFNYNHKTRSCVMRGCSLPVKRPARNHYDDYNAFWLASTTSGSCKYGMSSKKTSVSYGNFSF